MAEYDPPVIPDLPPAPLRNDPEGVFAERASNFVGVMNPWGQIVNDVAAWIRDAWGSIMDALPQVLSARDQAVAASDAAISAVGAQEWVSGQNYGAGEAVWSPIDLHTYRRRTPGSGVTDPSEDPTNWAQISGLSSLPPLGGNAGRPLIVSGDESGPEWAAFQLGTNAQGNKTISTEEPSGTSPGDIWYQVES